MYHYEWQIIHLDEHDDIIDRSYCELLGELLREVEEFKFDDSNTRMELVLMWDDESERAYATVRSQVLEDHFKDCWGYDRHKVPKRFHQELERILKTAKVK